MKIIHKKAKELLKIGLVAKEINDLIKELHREYDLSNEPADNYKFPGYCCLSINDCLCHGCPDSTVLKKGDLISIDIFFKYKGYCVDCCRSYLITDGEDISNQDKKYIALIDYNKCVLEESIINTNSLIEKNGFATYGDFGRYIYKSIISSPYSLSDQYCGHSIGESIHQGIFIPSSINEERRLIKEGDSFCVEPIISYSKGKEVHIKTYLLDKWYVMNKSGEKTSHWENTYIMKDNKIISIT